MSLLTAEDRALVERARQIKERPILFSAPMVKALLAGTKTQTRRVINPTPDWDRPEQCCSTTAEGWQGPIDRSTWAESADPEMDFRRCPYGGPGDRLWVREAWKPVPATAYRMSEGVHQTINPNDRDEAAIYAAGWDRSIPKWKPSIHMPRWASRLTLEVTEVRVERLQEISRDDAAAEGLVKLPATGRYAIAKGDQYFGGADHDPRTVYRWLWESINGAGSWDVNPWVWAVSFRVLDQAKQVAV